MVPVGGRHKAQIFDLCMDCRILETGKSHFCYGNPQFLSQDLGHAETAAQSLEGIESEPIRFILDIHIAKTQIRRHMF